MSTKFDEELSLATHKKHTIKFKIVFIGDQAVGKSSIINRFIKDEFDTTHNVSLGSPSRQSESTSYQKTLISKIIAFDSSSGIQQGRKDSKVSSPDIYETHMPFF